MFSEGEYHRRPEGAHRHAKKIEESDTRVLYNTRTEVENLRNLALNDGSAFSSFGTSAERGDSPHLLRNAQILNPHLLRSATEEVARDKEECDPWIRPISGKGDMSRERADAQRLSQASTRVSGGSSGANNFRPTWMDSVSSCSSSSSVFSFPGSGTDMESLERETALGAALVTSRGIGRIPVSNSPKSSGTAHLPNAVNTQSNIAVGQQRARDNSGLSDHMGLAVKNGSGGPRGPVVLV